MTRVVNLEEEEDHDAMKTQENMFSREQNGFCMEQHLQVMVGIYIKKRREERKYLRNVAKKVLKIERNQARIDET